jgi:HSP20 family protein
MQGDNRRQSQDSTQRDDTPSRGREGSPEAREQQRTDTSSVGSRGTSLQQSSPSHQRQGYGISRRDRDFGVPSVFGGGGGPFALLRRMEQEMDRMFERFGFEGFGGQRAALSQSGQGMDFGGMPQLWQPQVEVRERDGKLHVIADLPGLRKEDVNVSVEDDTVIIQGERRSTHEDQDPQRGFYRSERSYGTFYRAIPLPEGCNTEKADATFRDGVLEITFDAPAQQRRSRKLEITDASSSGSK